MPRAYRSGGSSVSCASGGSGDDYRANFAHNPASQIVIRTSQNAAYDWTNHYDVTRGYTANALNHYTTSGPQKSGARIPIPAPTIGATYFER